CALIIAGVPVISRACAKMQQNWSRYVLRLFLLVSVPPRSPCNRLLAPYPSSWPKASTPSVTATSTASRGRRQHDRAYSVRMQLGWEVDGAAQGDCAGNHARGGAARTRYALCRGRAMDDDSGGRTVVGRRVEADRVARRERN